LRVRAPSGYAHIYRYSAIPEFAHLLKNATDSLYLWQQPFLLEDICFIRDDGNPIFVTISHEKDAYLELDEHEYKDIIPILPSLELSEHLC
jgi:hypothetical protein